MSFGLSRMLRGIPRALPLFFSVILILLFFLSGVLFFSRLQLQDFCRRDVSKRLDRYLQERSTSALMLNNSKRKSGGLHGLSFVRLISDNEQFLYAESHEPKVDFQGVVNLDPLSSVVWISLDDVKREGNWTITSKEIETDLIVQAGVEHTSVVALYHQLRNIVAAAAILTFGVAGVLVFLVMRKSSAPLREAEKAVTQIISAQDFGLLNISKDHDLNRLYILLNNLISQNRQLVREMQESLDNVAHDLRTPMTRLRSVAEYGLQQNSTERLGEALSDCLEESERVLSMLGIMMSVAEAESGTMQLKKETVQLFDTIEDVINLYEYVADEKSISMKMEINTEIYITADKTRISQVWANIIDNAIKYGRDGGYVNISSEFNHNSIVILFEDDGMGISTSEQHKIWERLFRGDRSRTQQGLGLGLNYARAVVEAHGGEISVESVLGEYSRFKVVLPIDH